MKKRLKIISSIFIISIIFVSCRNQITENNPIDYASNISGIYVGELVAMDNPNHTYDAEVNIRKESTNRVEMDLYCEIMDTTLIFDLYKNNDSLMVCLSGNDFYNMYGHHRMGQHHMMDDEEGWSWHHHLDEDHEPGEMHFGGFKMQNHTFSYKFYSKTNHEYTYEFKGQRE